VVFFHLLPRRAVLIDSHQELINFYVVVRDRLAELVQDLRKHENTRDYYYHIRALDPAQLGAVARASRFLHLNKTGYNGLWRVNARGQHNVPFGRYKNPRVLDEANLQQVSQTLRRAELVCDDFSRVLERATAGTFVYLDPPYHPLSETASFTGYTAEAFGRADQERLAQVFRELDRRGCLLMLSNSDTPFIRELYAGYDIQVVYARRAISCVSDRRGPIRELVVRNYG